MTTPYLVAVPSDVAEKDGLQFHSAGDKYLRALTDCSGVLPVILPSMPGAFDIEAMLDRLDGVLITGATSNVHPPHYGEKPTPNHEPYDHDRDGLTLALIKAVLKRKMPLFCICRGFQELNVAFGGTLEAEIQTQTGRLDHRAPESDDLGVRYGPAHPITIEPGSLLHKVLGKSGTMVNTVHRQGIGQLGDGLQVIARAPDGTIEAITVAEPGNYGFVLGVQWHPEFRASQNPDSVRLFEAFGAAVRDHADARKADND